MVASPLSATTTALMKLRVAPQSIRAVALSWSIWISMVGGRHSSPGSSINSSFRSSILGSVLGSLALACWAAVLVWSATGTPAFRPANAASVVFPAWVGSSLFRSPQQIPLPFVSSAAGFPSLLPSTTPLVPAFGLPLLARFSAWHAWLGSWSWGSSVPVGAYVLSTFVWESVSFLPLSPFSHLRLFSFARRFLFRASGQICAVLRAGLPVFRSWGRQTLCCCCWLFLSFPSPVQNAVFSVFCLSPAGFVHIPSLSLLFRPPAVLLLTAFAFRAAVLPFGYSPVSPARHSLVSPSCIPAWVVLLFRCSGSRCGWSAVHVSRHLRVVWRSPATQGVCMCRSGSVAHLRPASRLTAW